MKRLLTYLNQKLFGATLPTVETPALELHAPKAYRYTGNRYLIEGGEIGSNELTQETLRTIIKDFETPENPFSDDSHYLHFQWNSTFKELTIEIFELIK